MQKRIPFKSRALPLFLRVEFGGERFGEKRKAVKSVGSTPVQCVDHLVPLRSETFRFSVLGVGAE